MGKVTFTNEQYKFLKEILAEEGVAIRRTSHMWNGELKEPKEITFQVQNGYRLAIRFCHDDNIVKDRQKNLANDFNAKFSVS